MTEPISDSVSVALAHDIAVVHIDDGKANALGHEAIDAIGAALDQRRQSGRGQYIDVSMLESMLTLTLTEMQAAQFDMPPAPSRPLFGPVQTADGFINLAVASERTFEGMAAATGRE